MNSKLTSFGFCARASIALAGLLGSGAAAAAPASTAAPGGLYVGYYQEDPRTNPEDPMPGAFVLTVPDKDAAFNGAMFFTFVGCQSSNVGAVKGVKAGASLSGSWSGNIDNSAQSGPYQGTYDQVSGAYRGVYSNSAGKQFKSIAGCIQYYIGPNGTWEMFPVEKSQPAGFSLDVANGRASWKAVPNTAMTLVYVIDAASAQAGKGNPVKFQTILPGKASQFPLAAAGLTKGKEYIAVVLVNDAKAQRLAFASKRFTAP